MHQDNKLWARNEEMLISDVRDSEGPIDPFKTIYQTKDKKNLITDKINLTTYLSPSSKAEQSGPGLKKIHNNKWTTTEQKFGRKKNRIFDDIKEAQPTRADLAPIFSSFNNNGIFDMPSRPKYVEEKVI